jgi:hypothetical protein
VSELLTYVGDLVALCAPGNPLRVRVAPMMDIASGLTVQVGRCINSGPVVLEAPPALSLRYADMEGYLELDLAHPLPLEQIAELRALLALDKCVGGEGGGGRGRRQRGAEGLQPPPWLPARRRKPAEPTLASLTPPP